MIKKLFVCLLSVTILCVITGCTKNPINETSTVSPSQSLSEETTASSMPPQSPDDVSTPSPIQSTESTSTSQPTNNTSTASPTPTQSESKTNTGDDKMDNNCKLIVKGKDITAGNHVKLNYEKKYAELPLTAVIKELGAKVEWQSKTTAKITFGGKVYILDTTKKSLLADGSTFNLIIPAPGSTLYCQAIDNEFILDSVNLKSVVLMMGTTIMIKIDYEKANVSIE